MVRGLSWTWTTSIGLVGALAGSLFFFLVFGAATTISSVVIAVAHTSSSDDDGYGAEFSFDIGTSIYFFLFRLVIDCATIPSLGGVFFVLALQVARAKKEIRELQKRAQDMSLTLGDYESSQRYIQTFSGGSRTSLLVLSVIALYNLAGWLAFIFLTPVHPYWGAQRHKSVTIAYDILAFGAMGKEACLFIALAYLAMLVNDVADDVCTEVYLWPTHADEGDEEIGDKEVFADRRRRMVEILAKAKNFVGPKDRKHRGTPARRLTAPTAGGISLLVLNVRWTTSYMAGLLVSVASMLLGAYFQPSTTHTINY